MRKQQSLHREDYLPLPACKLMPHYGALQPHCYQGVRLDALRQERLNFYQEMIWRMARHIEDAAPAGADTKSWKY